LHAQQLDLGSSHVVDASAALAQRLGLAADVCRPIPTAGYNSATPVTEGLAASFSFLLSFFLHCSWGFLRGDPGLRGLHGFESRRLPGSGALNVGRHLAAVAAQRLASTPWVDAALYSDARAEAVLTAAEAAWLAPDGSGYTGDRGGMCGVQGAASEGTAEPFCEGDGVGLEIVWDDGSPEPGSHLANALAALALVAVPPAGGCGLHVCAARC
jgi:hypothetical protein